jgi:hypothetical protein
MSKRVDFLDEADAWLRGDAHTLQFDYERWDAQSSSWVAQPLTGCTVRFSLKYSPLDADDRALAQLTSAAGGGIELQSTPSNRALIRVPPSATEPLLASTRVWYDVQVTEPDGQPYTPQYGQIAVLLDLSRATHLL